MNATTGRAPGGPGIAPRWTSSAKEGIGTAYASSAQLWFTLSHGIVNEIYYPTVDSPNTRDLQLLITDGETFCHEEKRDLHHQVEYSELGALLYRLTNSDPKGRYRVVKEIIGEPHSSVLLIHTRLEILDIELRGKLRMYALLAPHLKGTGKHNSAAWRDLEGRRFIQAEQSDIHLVFGCAPDFIRRSVGYAGTSDGWQDLMANYRMDWEFDRAEDGNIALLGEIDLSQSLEFVVAVALGRSAQNASTQLLQAFATPFAAQREKYVSQWLRTHSPTDLSAKCAQDATMVRLSQNVLLAHEDKRFPGAFVASLSIPWGETKDDSDQGGYHLVWTRDLVQTATALLASGMTEPPLRSLIWLASVQQDDGRMPQNSLITGQPYWTGLQLDEVAVPVLLAWRLRRAGALRQFDPWVLISRATSFLVLHGPVTAQERWEENAGYSPSTLASIIASLVAAAEFAAERKETVTEDFLLQYADWLAASLDAWTVTGCGQLLPGKPRHFVRLTPAVPGHAEGNADPDTALIKIANGGGEHPARNVVGGDFLQLVRLGVRAANDPVIVDSVAVIDYVLKHELPGGPCWRRYNHDGYGQKDNGSAFDGTGVGRSWPILTGERGHYELSAGRDPRPFVVALEKFANAGRLLPEQLWDEKDLPDGRMKFGRPTGSAMPLCWAHAEFISLVRSGLDGVGFDRIEPVYQRYVIKPVKSGRAMWSFDHAIYCLGRGKILRLIVAADATVVWSADNWANVRQINTVAVSPLKLWFADLPTDRLLDGAVIAFTFHWKAANNWEGRNFSVTVGAGK
jgi:glucoamylase